MNEKLKKVQLTPSQAALIKKYNLDPKKYVAEVLKLEKQNGMKRRSTNRPRAIS